MDKNSLTAEWDAATPVQDLSAEWDKAKPVSLSEWDKAIPVSAPAMPAVAASDVTENPNPFGGDVEQRKIDLTDTGKSIASGFAGAESSLAGAGASTIKFAREKGHALERMAGLRQKEGETPTAVQTLYMQQHPDWLAKVQDELEGVAAGYGQMSKEFAPQNPTFGEEVIGTIGALPGGAAELLAGPVVAGIKGAEEGGLPGALKAAGKNILYQILPFKTRTGKAAGFGTLSAGETLLEGGTPRQAAVSGTGMALIGAAMPSFKGRAERAAEQRMAKKAPSEAVHRTDELATGVTGPVPLEQPAPSLIERAKASNAATLEKSYQDIVKESQGQTTAPGEAAPELPTTAAPVPDKLKINSIQANTARNMVAKGNPDIVKHLEEAVTSEKLTHDEARQIVNDGIGIASRQGRTVSKLLVDKIDQTLSSIEGGKTGEVSHENPAVAYLDNLPESERQAIFAEAEKKHVAASRILEERKIGPYAEVSPVPVTQPELSPPPGPSGTERAAPAPLEHEGEPVSKAESKDILRTTEPPSKKQKIDLLSDIDKAIMEAPESSYQRPTMRAESVGNGDYDVYAGNKFIHSIAASSEQDAIANTNLNKVDLKQGKRNMIDIDIPGDGTFSVFNDKETLATFKKLVDKHFPTTPIAKEPKPYPTPWGKVKAAKPSLTSRAKQEFEAKKAEGEGNLQTEPISTTEQGGFLRLGLPKKTPNMQRVKGQDSTIAARLFGTLQVSDKYPVLKPIINRIIKAEMDWNHKRNRMEERLTQLFDKVEKSSVVQKIFGKRNTALTDIPDWIEGRKTVPEQYKGFVEEIRTVFKEYRDRVIKERTDKILAGLNGRQRAIYDHVRAGEDINSIEKVSKTAKIAVESAIKDIDEAGQWGLDPRTYFPRAFSGSYKFMDAKGNVLASGETARQAVTRLTEFLDKNPHRADEHFIGTSTLAEMHETKKALKEMAGESYQSALDWLGTVLPRKQYGALIGKATKAANEAVTAALGEAGVKVKVDLRGVASPAPRKKFVGFMQKRGTELKGDVQDPFKVMVSYIGAMERKFSVDKMKAEVQPMIEALPGSQANLKDIATKAMDWAGHYSWENKLVDEGRRKMAETGLAKGLGVSDLLRGKPYLATRLFSRASGAEAQLKLGFAPVKAVINRIGGVAHTWIKENPINWMRGRSWLKTEEGKRIFAEQGHYTGMDQPFSASGRESYVKATGNLLKPLGLFNRAEFRNRPEAFAAAFVKAKRAGATESQAIETAIQSAWLTQGLYTMSSLPVVVRGPIAKAGYQFKQYLMNEMRFMKSLTPAQWTAYVPYIMTVGGTKGAWTVIKSILPFTVIGALFINKGDELSEEMNVKHPNIHRGLPGFVFGQDWAAPSTWQLPTSAKELTGPLYTDALNTGSMVVKGLKNNGWTDEEINAYFSQLAPAMSNLYKAFHILSEGKIKKGTQTEQKTNNPWEAAANIAGSRSVKESAESDTVRYTRKKTADFNERKRVMTDKFFEAREDGDASKIMRQMIQEGMIPQKVTESGLEYDFRGLERSATDRQLTKLQRVIRTAPQPIKKEYYQRQKEKQNERSHSILPFGQGSRKQKEVGTGQTVQP